MLGDANTDAMGNAGQEEGQASGSPRHHPVHVEGAFEPEEDSADPEQEASTDAYPPGGEFLNSAIVGMEPVPFDTFPPFLKHLAVDRLVGC